MSTAAQNPTPDPARQLLRHILATLAYRAGKALRGAPDEFAGFRASATSRTPAQILAHLGDLMDWALSIVAGRQQWRDSEPLPWPQEVARFFRALEAFDAYLASGQPMLVDGGKLFQGGIADALTHVGQIGMLRRLAGSPVRGENYFLAEIVPGRVGLEQAAPVLEFD
ncbi:MAG TPA: hypothetical protein VEV17_13490 [Bryobacteraceae bacterium]|nr:hypothetical protein [Bryobacteraceae bacterium]